MRKTKVSRVYKNFYYDTTIPPLLNTEHMCDYCFNSVYIPKDLSWMKSYEALDEMGMTYEEFEEGTVCYCDSCYPKILKDIKNKKLNTLY